MQYQKGQRVRIKGGRKVGTVVGFETYTKSYGPFRVDYPHCYEILWDGYKFTCPVKSENIISV